MFSGRAEPERGKNKPKYVKENPSVSEPLHETISKSNIEYLHLASSKLWLLWNTKKIYTGFRSVIPHSCERKKKRKCIITDTTRDTHLVQCATVKVLKCKN